MQCFDTRPCNYTCTFHWASTCKQGSTAHTTSVQQLTIVDGSNGRPYRNCETITNLRSQRVSSSCSTEGMRAKKQASLLCQLGLNSEMKASDWKPNLRREDGEDERGAHNAQVMAIG